MSKQQQQHPQLDLKFYFIFRFGLYNLIGSGFISDDEASDSDSDSSNSRERSFKRKRVVSSPTDYKNKDDSAEDFFDITELADEAPAGTKSPTEDYDDIEAAIPAAKVTATGEHQTDTSSHIDKNGEATDDKELMPPPPQNAAPSVKQDETEGMSAAEAKKAADKKLETPLGAMLPSKYADVDVTEIFPDFRQDKVLRFSRLFGPGKFSSLPQIWRSVRRKAKKKRKDRDRGNTSESTSDSDEPRKCAGFNLTYAPTPTKDQIMSDDEDKLLSEKTKEEKEEKHDDAAGGDQKSKAAAADWRFGPAQIWYDMLDVPESGEGFNYGFKLKEKSKTEGHKENEEPLPLIFDPIPDDAFLMVSQLHWEDDVVWDGNAIKDKVEQKLNSKTNAAGWLPSSGSRTAGAVIGKSAVGVTPTLKDTKSILPMSGKFNKSQPAKHEEADDTWYSIFPVENGKFHLSKKNFKYKLIVFAFRGTCLSSMGRRSYMGC